MSEQMNTALPEAPEVQDVHEQKRIRIEKLTALQAAGEIFLALADLTQ